MVFENEEIMSSKEAVSLAVFVYLAGSHHPLASSFQDSLLLSWLIRSFGLFRQSDACARQVHSSTAPKWVGSVRGPSRWRGERRQTGPCVACRRQCANSWRALHSRIATCTTHCLLRRVHRIVTSSPGVYLLFFTKLFLEHVSNLTNSKPNNPLGKFLAIFAHHPRSMLAPATTDWFSPAMLFLLHLQIATCLIVELGALLAEPLLQLVAPTGCWRRDHGHKFDFNKWWVHFWIKATFVWVLLFVQMFYLKNQILYIY